MSSCASTPLRGSDNPLSDVCDAMAQSSPLVPPAAIRGKETLCGEQKTELDTFLKDPASLREAKHFLLHVDNLINQIVIATAPYEVSASLEEQFDKNISNYAGAILLLRKISIYKGAIPTNILLAILKKHRFDLPAGIEHNPANWAKVVAAAQDALTQKQPNSRKQHVSYHSACQCLIAPHCTVNVLLCTRVALMRKVYLLESGPKFWDKLDSNLSQIRKQADGDKKKHQGIPPHPNQDQTTNDVKDYELHEDVDTFQKEVHDLIEAGLLMLRCQLSRA
ncbi:hypothetical protein B0H10DRAFT_2198115 [Mycena sp. CBHHK59/15]|nr:hypothetical protein B0H10DRAFT_2198115 [Mycena sp. CBHHK59/15]